MRRQLIVFLAIFLATLVVVACDRGVVISGLVTKPINVDPWIFQHLIIDRKPLATYRINDIQIKDLDGDGLTDIWTSGRGSGSEAYQMVWYKNPDWTRYEIAKGDYKYGDIGDIDGDGDLDIVVGQNWFENTGNSQQKDWPQHSLGYSQEPDLVLVGDLNRDRRLDVVFTTKDELWWLPGPKNPKGSWEKYQLYKETKGLRTGGTLADIDLDGDLDILYGNAWFENPSELKATWTQHIIDPRWPAEARGAVADLNGDGRPDIILSDEERNKGIAWFKAPLEPKTSKWEKQTISPKYSGVHSLQVDDFNQDGKPDIFAAEMHTKGKHRVTVFENKNIATNQWIEHVITTTGSHNAKVGDVNDDGYPDIVGKNFEASDLAPLRVDLWLNQISGADKKQPLAVDRWQRHIIDNKAQSMAVFVDSGDLDGDGLSDIITGKYWYSNPGRWGDKWVRQTISSGIDNMVVVGDLDSDSDLDILGNSQKTFLWAENDGAGSFTQHENIAPVASEGKGDFLQGARAAQIVAGGNPEVIISWHNGEDPPGEGTQMFQIPTKVKERWSWKKISDSTNAEQIAIADIDGDGDLDIHLGTQWLRQETNGDWTTFEALKLSNAKAEPDRVELADLDNDGDLDVAIACEHANYLVWGEQTKDPSKPWVEHVISTDYLLMSMDVGDLDGDGNIDLVAGEHKGSGKVFVFQNEGNGNSWHKHTVDSGDYSGLDHHDGTQLADLDNDGDLDIISIGWKSQILVIYENKAILKTKLS